MRKITPFLWFNGGVQEAAAFYKSVFPAAVISSSNPMSAIIEIEGQELILFNGGPMYHQTPAFSLMVSCPTQQEIDEKWAQLIAGGGKESRCGWLEDKYGVSWQIVPPVLTQLINHPDREKADRALQAMLKMNKIIIADLQSAFDGQ